MEDETLLVRVDERVKALQNDIRELKETLFLVEKKYVTKHEFAPIRLFVFGAIGTSLASIGAAILSLVVRTKS